jgi:hypothetical protein
VVLVGEIPKRLAFISAKCVNIEFSDFKLFCFVLTCIVLILYRTNFILFSLYYLFSLY